MTVMSISNSSDYSNSKVLNLGMSYILDTLFKVNENNDCDVNIKLFEMTKNEILRTNQHAPILNEEFIIEVIKGGYSEKTYYSSDHEIFNIKSSEEFLYDGDIHTLPDSCINKLSQMEKAFRLSGIFKYLPSTSTDNISDFSVFNHVNNNIAENGVLQINTESLIYSDQYSDGASDDDFSIGSMLPIPSISTIPSSSLVSNTPDLNTFGHLQQDQSPFFLSGSISPNQFNDLNYIPLESLNFDNNSLHNGHQFDINTQLLSHISTIQHTVDDTNHDFSLYQNFNGCNSPFHFHIANENVNIKTTEANSNDTNLISENIVPYTLTEDFSTTDKSNIPDLRHNPTNNSDLTHFSKSTNSSIDLEILSKNNIQILIQNWMEVKSCKFKEIITYIYSDIIESFKECNPNTHSPSHKVLTNLTNYCKVKRIAIGKVQNVIMDFEQHENYIKKESHLKKGFFSLTCYMNDMVMDVSGAKKENGVKIQTWPTNKTVAQKWRMTSDCKLESGVKCGLFLDLKDQNKAKGSTCCIWEQSNSYSQKWFLTEDGYIVSKKNNLVVDVRGANKNKGTELILWPSHGNENQKWKIIEFEN